MKTTFKMKYWKGEEGMDTNRNKSINTDILSCSTGVTHAKKWLSVALFVLFSQHASALTRQQAETIVSNQVIAVSPYNATLVAYTYDPPGPEDMLMPGETLMPFDETSTNVIAESTWFFWLDYTPAAWFVHPAAFVLVSDASSAVEVIDVEWWPKVNGTNVFSSFVERTTSPDIFFGDPSLPPAADAPAFATLSIESAAGDEASTKWAIAVAGPANHPVANLDLNNMSNAWRRLGVPAGNIKTAKGTKKAFCDQIDALKNQAQPCDKLYFHWTGHGTKDFLLFGHPFDLTNEKLTWCQLADKLKATKSKSFCESIEACKSGGGAADLKKKVGGDGVTSTDDSTNAGFNDGGSFFTTAFSGCLTSNRTSYADALKWAKEQSTTASNQNPQIWGLLPKVALGLTGGPFNELVITVESDVVALCALQSKAGLTNLLWQEDALLSVPATHVMVQFLPGDGEFFRAETLLGIDSPPWTAEPDELDGTLYYSVTPFGLEPFGFQWLLNGLPMPGQNSDILIMPPPFSGAENDLLSVVVSNPVGFVESEPVPLIHDPLLIQQADGFGTQILLEFNMPLNPLTAEDPLSYQLFGEFNVPIIVQAQLLPDQQTVELLLNPEIPLYPGGPYFIQAPGVENLDGQHPLNGFQFIADGDS